MFAKKDQLQTDIHSFLGITAALIIIGFLFIYSASSIYALEQFGSSHYYVQRQLIGLTIALIGFIIARFINLDLLEMATPVLFFTALFATAATLIKPLGITIHGSSRWLNLQFFSLQPSELLKVMFVLYIAHFLTKKEQKPFTLINSYLPFLVIIGLTAVLLLKQPDFGLAVTLSVTAFLMLFIAGFPVKHLLITAATILPIVSLLIYTQAYRLKRILVFLNPWNDPQGAGFQIIQSLIAIGSGKWFGSGISHSKQKFFYLPMQHTDFIFSIIAEETGFVGASLVIFLYILLLYFGCKIAWQLKKTFYILSIIGLTLLLSLQALINIFVTVGLAPTKGIGLPFISYGNSSLICSCIIVGLIANMAAQETGSYKSPVFS